jgi:hypothetical protein
VSYDIHFYMEHYLFSMGIVIILNSLFQSPHKDYGLRSSSTPSNFMKRINVLSDELIFRLVEYMDFSPAI